MKPVSRSPPPPTAHRRERTLCSLLSTQHFHTPQLALILETKETSDPCSGTSLPRTKALQTPASHPLAPPPSKHYTPQSSNCLSPFQPAKPHM